jgi:hypothetical protein
MSIALASDAVAGEAMSTARAALPYGDLLSSTVRAAIRGYALLLPEILNVMCVCVCVCVCVKVGARVHLQNKVRA